MSEEENNNNNIELDTDNEDFNPKTNNGKNKVECWHDDKNGELTPRDVPKNSRRYHWFKCDICEHDFKETIHMILKNRWCPYCEGLKLCDNDDCEICYNNSFASFIE